MTFSKHNWNQLSESSKSELKRREAYEAGFRQGLNEAAPGFIPTGPDSPPGGPGYSPYVGPGVPQNDPGGLMHPAIPGISRPITPGIPQDLPGLPGYYVIYTWVQNPDGSWKFVPTIINTNDPLEQPTKHAPDTP